MNHVLVFGGGYKGAKRSTRFSAGETMELASHPVQSAGEPVYQPINYLFSLHRFAHEDGKEYLIAIHGDEPDAALIKDCIFREKPEPLK
ncbi:hypothetical protein LVQ71_08925 [Klebsiella pneumoniae]|uniref:hypothetical protein n=1 Tax=Klebsiella pneumoniae TaxID=573 RepID=UPI000FFBF7D9|nr:hypothetical protein [Klebsiella pneumoniae]HBQ6066095.1 hypothetical protein [Klebsiella pneumoniae subsp. pneumoniae]MCH0743511.1 hypothetical protein [Klebsiella pneumoniae]WFA37077.1 hypothetical protein LVQ71_08925 [Klebsiella pneumoniae]HBR3463195.1 hypothetical protein [Klebsiella pneumoniae]HBT6204647.1 hypothetical protein [Klebsiella pneumoniae]